MNTRPERLVLLGHPLGHSLSPRMQNAALQAASIPLRYEALDVPRSALPDVIADLRRGRAAGNVTIPYKEVVAQECDRLTDAATATGAVNTFWIAVDGALVGDNTDVAGFQAAVGGLGVDTRSARVGVLGAGGGASAVLTAMEGWGDARVRLYARTRQRAEQLVANHRITCEIVDSSAAAARDATLFVNATPVGLNAEECPVDVTLLPDHCSVLDLAYRPDETTLVRQARERGLRAADGLAMLVEQGALAFERWFGVSPDRRAMWAAVKR